VDDRPAHVTRWLADLVEPLGDWSPALAYEARDNGEWLILQVEWDGEPVGVLVLKLDQVAAGPVIDLLAAKFEAGRWARIIDLICCRMARYHNCIGVRIQTFQQIERLPAPLECINKTFFRWVE
jgi:CelD/BcsL family acetyltransferase involved in cellulose biosynthesis